MVNKTSTLLIKIVFLISSLTAINFVYAEEKKAISLSQVTKDVSYLASDKLKGRSNYSPEIRIAADYIANRFKESGLTAATSISNAGYFQKYQIIKTTPNTLNLMINGQKILAENSTMAGTMTSFSWQVSNDIKNTDFTIHSIGKDEDMRAIISRLNNEGGKHLVLLNPSHKALFERYQHYFQQGTTKLAKEKINNTKDNVLVIALSSMTVDKITNLNAFGESAVSENELLNVVAVIPGKTKPEEVVLYSAHYDHLGIETGEGDIIYNGADDDASGTTAIINLAQYYANRGNNARTLMFAAFSAEEIGGFGSHYFSEQLDPETITAMINIEMIGKPSKFGTGTLWMTGMERSDLGTQLNKTLAKLNQEIYEDPYPEQNLFYRSDNATLARLGVPAHSFSSTQLDKDEHYHQASDDLSSLNLDSLHQVIKTLATATQPLVDGSITPSRIDKNLIKSKGLIF
jgi:hypothetical protein